MSSGSQPFLAAASSHCLSIAWKWRTPTGLMTKATFLNVPSSIPLISLAHFGWLISAGLSVGNILCRMTTCEECGYDYESVPTDKLAGRLRDMGLAIERPWVPPARGRPA